MVVVWSFELLSSSWRFLHLVVRLRRRWRLSWLFWTVAESQVARRIWIGVWSRREGNRGVGFVSVCVCVFREFGRF